jgi:hypothetical protein
MIYSITHKRVSFVPPEKKGYRLLQVGAAKKEKLYELTDDSGQDHMSEKNPSWCELTGVYWMWKNCSDDIVGLVHYRRYFSKSLSKRKVLTEKNIKHKLTKYDIIVPNKVNLFQSVEKQFADSYTNDPKLLLLIRRTVKLNYPEYLDAYDKVMSGSEIYFCNMMICSKELFRQYCEWLFSILFDIEKNVDMTGYSDYQKRLYGFISERLLTVWIEKNALKVCELGMVNTDTNEGKKKELLKGLRRVYSYHFSESKLSKSVIDNIRKREISRN